MTKVNDLAGVLKRLSEFSDSMGAQHPLTVLREFSEDTEIGNRAGDFIAFLLRTTDQAVDEVMSSPNLPSSRQELFVKRVQRVRNFVDEAIQQPKWSGLAAGCLSEEFIDNLYMIDGAIVAGGYLTVFKGENAAEYADELKNILGKIFSSDLKNNIKQPICGHLKALIEIFHRFEVFGAQDAESRVKQILGEILLHNEELKGASPEAVEPLNELIGFIQKIYPSFLFLGNTALFAGNVALLTGKLS